GNMGKKNGVYIYDLDNGNARKIYGGREDDHSLEDLGGPAPEFPLGNEPNLFANCVRVYHRRQPPDVPFLSYKFLIDDLRKAAPAVEISDELGFTYSGCTFSDDGRMFCTVCQQTAARGGVPSGRVALWDPRTGERIGRVDTRGRTVIYPRFSPDGRDLAILGGNAQNLIYICSTTEMDVQRTLSDFAKKPGHGQVPISQIFYTTDGSYLVVFGVDGTLMFWETKDYREVLWVKLYPPKTRQWLWPSTDGRLLTTGGEKDEWDTVKFWDLDQFRALMRGGGDGKGVEAPQKSPAKGSVLRKKSS
ncbi:MAG: WD40 repeat domain-containing protein, partial [Isosphaeraceae bacterium]